MKLSALSRIRRVGGATMAARLLAAGAGVAIGAALALGALGMPRAGATTPKVTSAGSAPAPSIPPGSATTSNIAFFRQAATDRYGTAAAIASATFGTSAPTVILATGAGYADALAASYLAGTKTGGAPILLTDPSALSPATATALSDLHATSVVIVGGTDAVSPAVQSVLAARYQVSRIAGGTRYDTAAQIDTAAGTPVGTDSAGARTAILVSGTEFADALSAAPLAYARHLPVVLTEPTSLSPPARAVLAHDHITHVVQVGGSGAIDPSVTQALGSLGISVDEVAGSDRSATSTLLATDELENYGFAGAQADLASGADFADALAGGPSAGAAGARGVPVLLTSSGTDPGSAPAWMAGHCGGLISSNVFGGTAVLSASIVQLAGLACPSNDSVHLNLAVDPVPVTSGIASPPSTFALIATVSLCGPPGSEAPCRIGAGQSVAFTGFASRSGGCGSISPPSATTDSSGQASITYSPGTASGTCVVSATANHYSASVALPSQPRPACYSPPCNTQVCPYTSLPVTGPGANPAIIVCPLSPVIGTATT